MQYKIYKTCPSRYLDRSISIMNLRSQIQSPYDQFVHYIFLIIILDPQFYLIFAFIEVHPFAWP